MVIALVICIVIILILCMKLYLMKKAAKEPMFPERFYGRK